MDDTVGQRAQVDAGVGVRDPVPAEVLELHRHRRGRWRWSAPRTSAPTTCRFVTSIRTLTPEGHGCDTKNPVPPTSSPASPRPWIRTVEYIRRSLSVIRLADTICPPETARAYPAAWASEREPRQNRTRCGPSRSRSGPGGQRAEKPGEPFRHRRVDQDRIAQRRVGQACGHR